MGGFVVFGGLDVPSYNGKGCSGITLRVESKGSRVGL